MSIWLLSALILAPAIFWLGYFYYHDRFKPEPLLMTALAYLLGFLAARLCLWAYEILPQMGIPFDPQPLIGLNFSFFAYCIVVVGLVEEAFKFLPFLLIIRFKEFDEEIDGIFYASAIALGFASFENLSYIPTLEGFLLFGRAFASPLTHTIFASLWGYKVGLARIRKKPLWPAMLTGLGLAALFHGLFDFFTYSPLLRLGCALIILLIWIWRIRVSEILIKKEKAGNGA